MKYIKKYEKIKQTFKVGDWVKITPNPDFLDEIKEYLNDNIGIIYDIEDEDYDYNVKYTNVPKHLHWLTRFMGSNPTEGLKSQGEIFVAKERELRLATKDEIETQLAKEAADKYNL